MSLKTIDHRYNLSRHLIPLMQDNPFYAELSRHIGKRYTHDLPTACVTFDPKEDQVMMYVNPTFMEGGKYTVKGHDGKDMEIEEEGLSNSETRGTLLHEFNHIVFGHLGARMKTPADDWNVATDLSINSMIVATMPNGSKLSETGAIERPLPRLALIPGQRPWVDPQKLEKLSPERKKALEHFSDLIESFPIQKSSDWYFTKLQEDKLKNPDKYPPEPILITLDDHGGWSGDVPDEMKEYVSGKVKAIVEKAVRFADERPEGWGSIPAELREEIRRSVSNVIDWRAALRQFVGNLIRGERTTSIKRINRRYPYIHPGTKRGYTAKLLIAIDESGSVDDQMLEMFFAELDALTRKVDISLLHFDCYCDPQDLYEWKRGMRPELKRVRGGGTDFNAPTSFVNDPANRGRWDGMLIMTDGQAGCPGPSRIKRGWVLGQGCTLAFDMPEAQIFLSKERPMSGAWR